MLSGYIYNLQQIVVCRIYVTGLTLFGNFKYQIDMICHSFEITVNSHFSLPFGVKVMV